MLQTKTWRLLLKLCLEDYYQRCQLTAPKMIIECSRGYLKNLSKLCPTYCYKVLTNGPTNLFLADSNNLQVCTTNTFQKGHCLVVCTFLEIQSLIGTDLHWAFNSELSQVTENSTKDCQQSLIWTSQQWQQSKLLLIRAAIRALFKWLFFRFVIELLQIWNTSWALKGVQICAFNFLSLSRRLPNDKPQVCSIFCGM